jgi:hypothetical protein
MASTPATTSAVTTTTAPAMGSSTAPACTEGAASSASLAITKVVMKRAVIVVPIMTISAVAPVKSPVNPVVSAIPRRPVVVSNRLAADQSNEQHDHRERHLPHDARVHPFHEFSPGQPSSAALEICGMAKRFP